jgi:hypothetical protein
MKTTSTIAVLFSLLILGLESTSGFSLAAFNHTNNLKNKTEKIIFNTKAVPQCNDKDGKYPCTN